MLVQLQDARAAAVEKARMANTGMHNAMCTSSTAGQMADVARLSNQVEPSERGSEKCKSAVKLGWPASSDNEREQLNGGDPKYQRR